MKILISSCLLGKKVRYDGGHCLIQSPWLEELAAKGRLVSVCPEVEAGMGIPREPIELRDGKVVNRAGKDMTDLFRPALAKIDALVGQEQVVLAILKEESPSCGSHWIYDGSFSGRLIEGQGIVAKYLSAKMPVFSERELAQAQAAFESLAQSGR